MTTEIKTFYCLRCQHRFLIDYDKDAVVERNCPKCTSNSVRLETDAAKAARQPTQGA